MQWGEKRERSEGTSPLKAPPSLLTPIMPQEFTDGAVEMKAPARKRLINIISDMSDDEVNVLLSVLERPGYVLEKRKFSRMRYAVPVDCISNGESIRANLRDLSVGGVFVAMTPSENPFIVGQELLLKIPYPGKEKYARIRGRIVRAALDGVGVEFENAGIENNV